MAKGAGTRDVGSAYVRAVCGGIVNGSAACIPGRGSRSKAHDSNVPSTLITNPSARIGTRLLGELSDALSGSSSIQTERGRFAARFGISTALHVPVLA